MKFNRLLYILPIFSIVACQPEIDDIDFNGGSADFSRTVAVGNSLTAGFQSNALSLEGQMNSLPSIIAGQLKLVGGGEFTQPLLSGEAGAKGAGVNRTLIALNLLTPELSLTPVTNCKNETSLSPSFLPKGSTSQGIPNAAYSAMSFLQERIGSEGPFNNVGVPAAKSFHLIAPGYGDPAGLASNPPTANPFYVRFANPTDNQETVLGAAMRVNPTFFQLWIGNNDVLGYALDGGNNPNENITPIQTFTAVFNQLVSTLTSNGAKGVIANIPNIKSIPHFTTVPIGTDQINNQNAALLNGAYSGYNFKIDSLANAPTPLLSPEEAARRKIVFNGGMLNTFVVIDPTLTSIPNLPKYRQIVPGELLTLTTNSDSLLCFGLGTSVPINPTKHLTLDEIAQIENAISSFNAVIKAAAISNQLAFVDINARLNELATVGIKVSGINFTSELVRGGAFSLDGVHPSTRGYAIIANDFIDAINKTYNANIPKVDVTRYPALETAM